MAPTLYNVSYSIRHLIGIVLIVHPPCLCRLLSLIIEDRQSLLGVERAGGGVLLSALSAISQLVELYSDLPSFSELTAPLLSNLKQSVSSVGVLGAFNTLSSS